MQDNFSWKKLTWCWILRFKLLKRGKPTAAWMLSYAVAFLDMQHLTAADCFIHRDTFAPRSVNLFFPNKEKEKERSLSLHNCFEIVGYNVYLQNLSAFQSSPSPSPSHILILIVYILVIGVNFYQNTNLTDKFYNISFFSAPLLMLYHDRHWRSVC